jgi:hypothetical protein
MQFKRTSVTVQIHQPNDNFLKWCGIEFQFLGAVDCHEESGVNKDFSIELSNGFFSWLRASRGKKWSFVLITIKR